MGSRKSVIWCLVLGSCWGSCFFGTELFAQEASATIRSAAVLDLTFEEPEGDFKDSAGSGAAEDLGKAVNNPARVDSPFFGQRNKKALSLTGSQFVQVADSADLDQVQAVSFSFYFLNLVPSDDATARGIVAKRKDVAGNTNYGINYVPKTDIFQVYFHDGSGFRIATYSVADVIGYQRPVFLTASLEVADAPEPDVDNDADDVRIRLYINGKAIVPKSATNGFVKDQDAWLPDVNAAGLANDAPLIVGGSTPTIEFTSGVIDELTVIPRALNADEAKRLFAEVAGPQGELLTLPEPPPASPAPTITAVSLNGLQVGKVSRLVISGANFAAAPSVLLPIPRAEVSMSNAAPNRLMVQVNLPGDTAPGIFPLQIKTENGVSNPFPIIVDNLPQFTLEECSPENPLEMPCAVSGQVAGGNQAKIYVTGKKGDSIVVDLECSRLGATMTPVLEWKSLEGTPLAIQWGQVELHGDPRIVTTLPDDGVYFAEIHDLAYRAPGASPFRVKIGRLPLVDVVLPLGLKAGSTRSVLAVGSELTDGKPVELTMKPDVIPLTAVVPNPLFQTPFAGLIVSDGVDVVEAAPAPEVDARFTDAMPVYLNGRISARKEQDRFLLTVTPGQKLKFQIATRSLPSPLDPKVTILHGDNGNVLAALPVDPVGHEPSLEYTVPANLERILVAVEDNLKNFGSHHLYRVRVAPSALADFELKLSTDRIQIAEDGSVIANLDVVRRGENGEISLSIPGQQALDIRPNSIPAGVTSTWVTLSAQPNLTAKAIPHSVQIVGSPAANPAHRRAATMADDARRTLLKAWDHRLSVGVTSRKGIQFSRGDAPLALFRGTDVMIPVAATFAESAPVKAIRMSLLTTEKARPVDPNDAKKGNLPTVAAVINQALDSENPEGFLRINVPLDVAESSIDLVIQGDLVLHPYATNVIGQVAAAPFRLPVKHAVTVTPEANQLKLTSGMPVMYSGTVERAMGFTEPVTVQLQGFPAGYEAPAVVLAPDQSRFELSVTAPKVPNAAAVPNIVLKVMAHGKPLIADMAVTTNVMPAAQ